MSEQIRLVVDADVCVGIGQCEMLEPEVFEYDEDAGLASVRDDATLPRDRADAVVKACPSGAIKIAE
mgnify:CR=1 FL=1